MKPGPALRARIPALVILAAAILSCGRLSPRSTMTENQSPEITLDAPSFGSSTQFNWRAHDPDGRIDHYVYALNPASVDRVDASWTRTDQTKALVQFPRAAALGRATRLLGTARSQIFTVRAVDDRGAESAPAFLALADSNEIEPQVIIDNPPPNAVFTPIVPPTFEIRWRGQDLDGRIVKYKFQLFGRHNPDFPDIPDFVALVQSNPDTLNGLYGPDFASWTEVGANVTSTTYSDQIPDELYIFAITALDDDGHYSTVFSLHSTVLRFAVAHAGTLGPRVCVSSPIFNYCSESGGGVRDLSYEITTTALAVSWFAQPMEGSAISGYRWVLDPTDTTGLGDINDKGRGPNRWTPWSLSNTSTTVGPFAAGSQHNLYIQARDNNDLFTTLRLQLQVVGFAAARQLLVVDDTRLTPDQVDPSTGLYVPRGTWPTAAELDTFLYARGGNPWRGCPAGTLSTPGILNGYDFDTVGTRGNTSGIVPLSLLSQYRQVMWFTDDVGATYTGSPIELLAPTTSLRFMSQPGQSNTLAAYVAQGGELWLSGGGAAYATLINWGRRNTPPNDWTNADQELIAGRFMYDFSHWRSSVAIAPARQALINTPDWAPPEWSSTYSIGRGWSGHGVDRTLSQPNYGALVNNADVAMSVLNPRTCTSDPPPPLRFCNSFYLVSNYSAEYIGRVSGQSSPPNFIREDFDSRPNHERLESTLDTLYSAIGGSMPSQLPVMTYYHGFESGSLVFSGFPLWYFQRRQVQELADFVLQDIWGLTKQPAANRAAVASRRR